MLKRKVYDRLMDWKNHGEKPLLVFGQRQIGKTYIIDKFGKENFENYIYADLSKDAEFLNIFKDDDQSIGRILMHLSIISGIDELDPSKTLIFFDEIQECAAARSALKSFAVDGRYKVIASGSMLGVTNRADGGHHLIPMGYEEQVQMFGLDFEEFLWANNIPLKAIEEVKENIRGCTPIDEAMLYRLSELFKVYQIVGGMPESVQAYVKDRNSFAKSSEILDALINQCRNDINKYNDGINAIKTSECFLSIPSQLSETNKKFQYSRINGSPDKRKTAEKYMENLLWIKDAGYGNFCYGLKQITRPIQGQVKRDVFKIYLSDTGMLTHMYGKDAIAAIFNSDTSFNSGAITENAVAECIMKSGLDLLYYQNNNGEGRMEIDFILNFIGGPVAVEVKSGKSRNSPSLSKISDHWDVKRKIKLENGNVMKGDDGVEHYPLFAAAFLHQLEDVPDYLK